MKKTLKFILFFVFITGIITGTEVFPLKTDTDLSSDTQAFNYCKAHKNTYVVIVWPKGFDALEYITTHLNKYASVKYVKTMAFKKETIFLLYRAMHKKMSYKSAKKYFKPYLSKYQQKPQPLAALILETDAPLETLLKWKKEIRNHIGQSYYSIHINDRYLPETIEAAQAVFCDLKPRELTSTLV